MVKLQRTLYWQEKRMMRSKNSKTVVSKLTNSKYTHKIELNDSNVIKVQ